MTYPAPAAPTPVPTCREDPVAAADAPGAVEGRAALAEVPASTKGELSRKRAPPWSQDGQTISKSKDERVGYDMAIRVKGHDGRNMAKEQRIVSGKGKKARKWL